MTRGRPRAASRTSPIGRATTRPSSISAAVIAETVVGLRSVRPQISTREIGPCRRIESITWERVMARISSGSAVFIARFGQLRPTFFRVEDKFHSEGGGSMTGTGHFGGKSQLSLTDVETQGRFITHTG